MTELLWRTARRGGGWAVVLAVAALAEAVSAVLLPAALALAVDAALTGAGLRCAVTFCAALILLSATAEVLSELATGGSSAGATAWLRRLLVAHTLAGGPATRPDSGDLTSRVVGGAADAGIAPAAAIQAAVATLPPIGAMTALALIDWRIAVTLGLALPVIAVLLRAFVRDTTDTVHRYLDVQGTIAGRLTETLRGARTVAAAGTAEQEADRILAALPRLRHEGFAMWRTQGRIAAQGLLAVLLLQVAVLAVAAVELAAGRISTGQLIAAGQYAGLAAGLGPIITEVVRLGRARAGTARAAEVLAQPVTVYGEAGLAPGPGTLEFRAVSAADTLHRLDLVVPGGKVVAVVGGSGSGKSLLAALAGRLTDPDEGEVLLDGVPVDRLSRVGLRQEVGYAFARPALFGDTVQDAIGFGARGAPPGFLRACAVTACADPFLRRLPQGYETPLAEAPMSGGELQRLGLARAFTHPGRLLILDDATSSLDTATELQVADALQDRLGDRTRLIIAHRAGTAARADLVVWLDEGRLRGYGRHCELWRDRAYRAVFAALRRQEV